MSNIEIQELSKSYGSNTVLDGVSFSIKAGELFCLFGPPACGKSTLLRVLLGLEAQDKGSILVEGKPIDALGPSDRGFAMVFQNLALFSHMTVYENIAFPLRERNWSQAELDKAIDVVASKLGLTPLLQKVPANLSGGERQRVAIGRALVRPSDAMLMDEPISALDARLREVTRVELKALQRERQQTIVYVTHDQEEALSVADRLCVLNEGRVEQVGTPDEIYNHPSSTFVAGVMGAPRINILNGSIDPSGVKIDLPDLDLVLTLSDKTEVSGTALVGIRPELFTIAAKGQPGFSTTISHVEPLGAQQIATVKLSGVEFKISVPSRCEINDGDEVMIALSKEPVHLFCTRNGSRLDTIHVETAYRQSKKLVESA